MSFALADLDRVLADRGLCRLGGFHLDDHETLLEDQKAGKAFRGGTLLLIGNDGRRLWERSGEEIEALKAAGEANPLDHWTQSILDPVAARFGVGVVYPFSGPPHSPFTRWALRSTNLHQSPLGLTIHPEFGLWHAFRAAFHVAESLALDHVGVPSPCDSCSDKPCLTACPVGAFTGTSFDVEACRGHLHDESVDCWPHGCLARVACPVGSAWHYGEAQARFHTSAFSSSGR